MDERAASALKLLTVWLGCCLLGASWVRGSVFFAFLMALAHFRGYLWGIGGHIRWGTPKAQYETGECAPGCPACGDRLLRRLFP